jgi:DNA-binding transcriptional regulator YiaG
MIIVTEGAIGVKMERKAFDKILNGLNEARSFARGEKVQGLKVHRVDIQRTEIAGLRVREGLTQSQFAGSVSV